MSTYFDTNGNLKESTVFDRDGMIKANIVQDLQSNGLNYPANSDSVRLYYTLKFWTFNTNLTHQSIFTKINK